MDPNEVIAIFRRNITEHYYDITGRVSRKEFWYFILASVVVYIGAAIVDAILRTGLLGNLIALALLLPTLGLGIRRMQDTGRNGTLVWIWAVVTLVMQLIGLMAGLMGPLGGLGLLVFFLSIGWLIGLAMLVLAIVLIYFWVQPGVSGTNQYGPDPLAAAEPPAAPA